MARAPLAKGDDGSANRYPVRICGMSYAGDGVCVKPLNHEGLCEDVHRYLFTGEREVAGWRNADPNCSACVRICGMSYAGYGGCVKPLNHEGLCEDVHRYLFTGRREVAGWHGYRLGRLVATYSDEYAANVALAARYVDSISPVPAALSVPTPERFDPPCESDES